MRIAWTALVIAAAVTGGCASEPGDSSEVPASVDARVGRVRQESGARTFEAGGVVRARTTAQVSSRILAEVRRIPVQPGDRVVRGQTLVVLDDRDLAARHAQAAAAVNAATSGVASARAAQGSADAQLVLAQAQYQRIERLHGRKSATAEEFDRATAELRGAESAALTAAARVAEASAAALAAEAAARAAEVMASHSTIPAPFDALVTARHIEPGNMASPGTPLVTVESLDGLRLEVLVDESRARWIDVGDAAAVIEGSQGDDRALPGRVAEVSRAIDPVSRTFLIKIDLPAGTAMRSGTYARARLEAEPRQALVVPASAVQRRGQMTFVFALDDEGVARLRAVSTGPSAGETIEVLAGVQEGERIVLDPPPSLRDGTPVRAAGSAP